MLDNKNTQIVYTTKLPDFFNAEILKNVYGYTFELNKVEKAEDVSEFNGSIIFISNEEKINTITHNPNIDFYINNYSNLGSVLLINGVQNESYISSIQHVRRRETIAITPSNALTVLKALTLQSSFNIENSNVETNKTFVLNAIKEITGTTTKPLVSSSGLSIQYAILMGLIHDAKENHKGKNIKIIVPPNCYGGTNDQARRVAACIDNVEV